MISILAGRGHGWFRNGLFKPGVLCQTLRVFNFMLGQRKIYKFTLDEMDRKDCGEIIGGVGRFWITVKGSYQYTLSVRDVDSRSVDMLYRVFGGYRYVQELENVRVYWWSSRQQHLIGVLDSLEGSLPGCDEVVGLIRELDGSLLRGRVEKYKRRGVPAEIRSRREEIVARVREIAAERQSMLSQGKSGSSNGISDESEWI